MNTTTLSKMVLAVAGAALLALTAACNTVEGAGKDVSATGHAVTDAARDTKQKM